MRRILILITDLEIGGTPTVVRELALRLRRPGEVHVEVACLRARGPVAQQLDEASVAVIALGATRATQFVRVAREVKRLTCDGQIDTVISFLVHANAAAASASRSCPGVRFIQSIQTTQPSPAWHWWVQQFAARSADTILVPSSAVAQVAEERCNVAPARIVMIPNAIEPSEFPRVNVFRGPSIRVGFLGRLDPVKNIGALIRAFGLLRDAPVECHIFGEGPQQRSLESLARATGAPERIHFHGVVARPQDALTQFDMLVLPSTHEGFGLVLIEAMAAGVPVICGRGGGALDIVSDRRNGLLVGPGSLETEIRDRVTELWHDAALRDQVIANGLQTVRERFSWDVVLPMYHRLLHLKQD